MVIAKNGVLRVKSGRAATFVVAASNSEHKDEADYICDGVDDEVQIQAAIDALPVDGGEIKWLEGKYYFSAGVTVTKSNVKLDLGQAKIYFTVPLTGFLIEGTSGSSTYLTSDADARDNVINVTDASIFSVGDYVLIGSDAFFGPAKKREIHKIRAVDTGLNTITILRALFDDYKIADNAFLEIENMLTNVTVSGGSIDGQLDPESDVSCIGVSFVKVAECICENVKILNIPYIGIMMGNGVDSDIKKNHVCGVARPSLGYGIAIVYASNSIRVSENYLAYCRHGTMTGTGTPSLGSPKNISFNGNYYAYCTHAAADAHEGADLIYFKDNVFVGCSHGGIVLAARRWSAINSLCVGCSTCIDTRGDSFSEEIFISNCEVRNGANSIVIASSDLKKVAIEQVRISKGSAYGVCISDVPAGCEISIDTVVASENTNYYLIRIIGSPKLVNITNSRLDKCWRAGMYINGALGGRISGNDISNSDQGEQSGYQYETGLLLKDCTNMTVIGNRVFDDQAVHTQRYGIREYGTSNNNIIRDNRCYDNTTKQMELLGAKTKELAYSEHSDLFMDVLAASANVVHAAIVGTGAEQEITTAITNPDVPRNVSITSSANSTGDVVITGVDAKSNSVTDTITIVTGGIAYGVVAFSTVSKITIPATVANPDTIEVGISDKLGLSNTIYASGDVYKVKVNNADDPTIGTVNTTYCTVDCATINAADDITIWYKCNLNMIS